MGSCYSTILTFATTHTTSSLSSLCYNAQHVSQLVHHFQVLLGEFPKLDTKGHLLGVTLMSPNGYIHPAILYGKWKSWDGKPMDEKPLFYHGLDQVAGEFAIKVCDEIVAIAQGIMKQRPNVSQLKFALKLKTIYFSTDTHQIH